MLSVDKDKKKIALSIKRAEVDPWTTVEQRYSPGQLVNGVVTKIAPFGAFARIEDGIEGLIHLSELTPGVDPKSILYEGAQLQLRILRIDAERRRLGLSLRQVEELDKEPSEEASEETSTAAPAAPAPREMPSLAEAASSTEAPQQQEPATKRGERRERNPENPLLSGLSENGGELTAMAEAFRAAARQRSKDESEPSDQ